LFSFSYRICSLFSKDGHLLSIVFYHFLKLTTISSLFKLCWLVLSLLESLIAVFPLYHLWRSWSVSMKRPFFWFNLVLNSYFRCWWRIWVRQCSLERLDQNWANFYWKFYMSHLMVRKDLFLEVFNFDKNSKMMFGSW
jgi:hypothetical protein